MTRLRICIARKMLLSSRPWQGQCSPGMPDVTNISEAPFNMQPACCRHSLVGAAPEAGCTGCADQCLLA